MSAMYREIPMEAGIKHVESSILTQQRTRLLHQAESYNVIVNRVCIEGILEDWQRATKKKHDLLKMYRKTTSSQLSYYNIIYTCRCVQTLVCPRCPGQTSLSPETGGSC